MSETNNSNEVVVSIKNLQKAFGDNVVLRDIDLDVHKGEVVVVLGPSGSGKSTMLRCINRLEHPTSGSIIVEGVDVCAKGVDLNKVRTHLGMVFQQFNLFPHLSVKKNVMLAQQKVLKRSKEEAEKIAVEELTKVGLAERIDFMPSQLSGGQQQRVAIARALATDPKVLLCDEATSALDPNTTHAILELIRDINRKLGITVVLITHQMSVVEAICNRVAILDEGTVVEEGEVSAVFSSPKSAAARRLVFPQGAEEILKPLPGEHRLRVVFHGAPTTRTPLIAQMAMERQIAANILSASTQSIGDRVYGNMLLSIAGGAGQAREAAAYLQNIPDILVEEVPSHV